MGTERRRLGDPVECEARARTRPALVGVWIALATMAVVGALAYRTVTGLVATLAWVAHSHELTAAIDSLRSSLGDAAAARRAYELTGNPDRLGEAAAANAQSQDTLVAMRTLAAGDPVQRNYMNDLEPALTVRAQLLDELAQHLRKNPDPGTEVAAAEEAAELGVRVRAILAAMAAHERAALVARETQTASAARVAQLVGLAGTVAGFGVLLYAFAQLRREVRRRLRSEKALFGAHAFLDSIVENLPTTVLVKNADNLRFERVNRAGEHLLGKPRDELIGKTDFDVFPADQAARSRRADEIALTTGAQVDAADEPIDTPSGRRFLHTRRIPILDVHGLPRSVLAISQDVTERREIAEQLQRANDDLETRVQQRTAELFDAQEQLRQSQKMEAIGRLAGGIAHDFNNLLSVILSYATLAKAHRTDADALAADLEEIRRAADRAAGLTRQLLAFGRQQMLAPKVVDLGEILGGMDKMLRRVIGEDIELTSTTAKDLPRVRVDPGQIEQMILNLVVNARDAMPSGGRLTIDTAYAPMHESVGNGEPGPHVVVTVTDTGTGMSEATRTRMFEPFFTTKEHGKGTGLGLSTVFGIVQQSGGTIAVRSEPGKGTCFRIGFPAAAQDRLSLADATPRPVPSGNETILLVEDEEQVRRVAKTVLESAGYRVLAAGDGVEAERICNEHRGTIDLLLTDVVMPRMGGRELVERLKASRPDTRVLFMSGYTDDTVVRHGVLDDEVAFLQKPITPDALKRMVRVVLDESRRALSSSKLTIAARARARAS